MSYTAEAAAIKIAQKKEQIKTSTNEPRFDCISYNFAGKCNRLDALYCKVENCRWCMTHDDLIDNKRASLGGPSEAHNHNDQEAVTT